MIVERLIAILKRLLIEVKRLLNDG